MNPNQSNSTPPNNENRPSLGSTEIADLEAYFKNPEFLTKDVPAKARPFVDAFGALRTEGLEEVKRNHPALYESARLHMTQFTNARVKAGMLAKLFVGNIPPDATRQALVKALNLGTAPFQLILPKDPKDATKHRGFAFLTVQPDVAKRLKGTPIKLGGNDIRFDDKS